MAAGHGGRAEPPGWRGLPAPARPGGVRPAAPCRASFIPGAVSGAPGNRASLPTSAARASRSWPSDPVPPGDRPVGAVRGPSPRRVERRPGVPRRARSSVRAPGAGRSNPDGPWRRGPGPGSRRPVRAERSARGGPGPAGLRAAVRGGPVVRPGQRAPGEARPRGCSLAVRVIAAESRPVARIQRAADSRRSPPRPACPRRRRPGGPPLCAHGRCQTRGTRRLRPARCLLRAGAQPPGPRAAMGSAPLRGLPGRCWS